MFSWPLFKKCCVFVMLVAFVSGCASKSESIKSSYVSPLEYQTYNCDQIGQEMSRVGRRLSEVSGVQDKTASKDAVVMGVGMVLFWPSLFFLASGDDQEAEISRLKGEAEALEQCAINKQCTKVLAQIETSRKAQEEQEEKMKAQEAIVDERYQNCVDSTGPADCDRSVIEAEVAKEEAEKAEPLKAADALVEPEINEPTEEAKSQANLTHVAKSDETAQVFRVKCPKCSNILSYEEKYAGTSTKCMQCDEVVMLP